MLSPDVNITTPLMAYFTLILFMHKLKAAKECGDAMHFLILSASQDNKFPSRKSDPLTIVP